MKQLNSLAIHCRADETDAERHIVTRNNVTYSVLAHCKQDAEDAVTAHLATPQEAAQEPELPLP